MENYIILFIIFLGVCVLEYVLAGKKSTWYGLICPIISFSFAVMLVLLLSFSIVNTIDLLQVIASALITLVTANIPTVILSAIYLYRRKSLYPTNKAS